jgi:hypothetical protein
MLEEYKPNEGWFRKFVLWAIQQIEEYKIPIPLSLSDIEMSRDLLLALSAIATLHQPMLERILSSELFGDSKRLEQMRGAIVSVLRIHASDTSLDREDDWQLLQAHNVFRPPEYVPIAGTLSLVFADATQNVIEGRTLHLDATLPSIALSEDILRTASISSWDARTLVTIENLTSFGEFLLIRPVHIMAIFTSGFASPALISFLHRLRVAYPHVPFFHWGDIDVGGLGILAHLRHHIENISPLCMDATTFAEHQKDTQPLTENDRIGMMGLLNNDMLKDCSSLIQYLLESNRKLEQESIRASHALSTLEKHLGKEG